jgi:hypothetical protein
MKCIILAAAAMFTFSFSAMAVAQENGESSEASEAGEKVSDTAAGEEGYALDMSGVVEKAGEAGGVVGNALLKTSVFAAPAPF